MNVHECGYEKVVVVTALIERRHLVWLVVENPFHCLVGAADASNVVLGVGNIVAVEHLIAIFLGVGDNLCCALALANELAELVVSSRVGCLREVDGMLNDSCNIFCAHCLAVENLYHYVALCESHVLQTFRLCKSLDVELGVSVDCWSCLIHGRGEPL